MSNTHQTLYCEPRFLGCVLSTMKWCESRKESWKKIRLLKLVSKCNKLIFAIFFWPTGYIARRAHRWQHSVVFLKSNTELTIFTCTPSSPTDIHWPLSRALTPDNQRTRNTPDPPEGNMKFLLLLVCLALNILCITVQLKVPKQVENIQKKKIQGV